MIGKSSSISICLIFIYVLSVQTRTIYQGRQLRITPKKCSSISPLYKDQPGLCMFNLECQEKAGVVIGACVDRFLFGACCYIKGLNTETQLVQETNSNPLVDLSQVNVPVGTETIFPIETSPTGQTYFQIGQPGIEIFESTPVNVPVGTDQISVGIHPTGQSIPGIETFEPIPLGAVESIPGIETFEPTPDIGTESTQNQETESTIDGANTENIREHDTPPTINPNNYSKHPNKPTTNVDNPILRIPMETVTNVMHLFNVNPDRTTTDSIQSTDFNAWWQQQQFEHTTTLSQGNEPILTGQSQGTLVKQVPFKYYDYKIDTNTEKPPRVSTFMYVDSNNEPLNSDSVNSYYFNEYERRTDNPNLEDEGTTNFQELILFKINESNENGGSSEKVTVSNENDELLEKVSLSNEDDSWPEKVPSHSSENTLQDSDTQPDSGTIKESVQNSESLQNSNEIQLIPYGSQPEYQIVPTTEKPWALSTSKIIPLSSTSESSFVTWSSFIEHSIPAKGEVPSNTVTEAIRPVSIQGTETLSTGNEGNIHPVPTVTEESNDKAAILTSSSTTTETTTKHVLNITEETSTGINPINSDSDKTEPKDEIYEPLLEKPDVILLNYDELKISTQIPEISITSQPTTRKPTMIKTTQKSSLQPDIEEHLDDFVNQVVQGLAGSLDNLNLDEVILKTPPKIVMPDDPVTVHPLNVLSFMTNNHEKLGGNSKTGLVKSKPNPKPVTTTTTSKPLDYRRDCGVRSPPTKKQGRIVGGKPTTFGRWPWQALVREATWLGLFSKNKCGGVLISPKYVLTAAHCQPGFLATLTVVLGDHDLSSESESTLSITKNVRRVIVHRDYNAQTFENDIALLELESAVEYQPHIVPICMPNDLDDIHVGQHGFVTGWGRLKYGGGVPQILHEVDVPILNNTDCQNMFLKSGHIKAIRESFICAGYAQGTKDSCEGDSGGPLAIQRGNGQWVLAGTVSHGIKCAYPNLPGVYMRMTYYKQWIKRVTGTS